MSVVNIGVHDDGMRKEDNVNMEKKDKTQIDSRDKIKF